MIEFILASILFTLVFVVLISLLFLITGVLYNLVIK